MAFSKENSIEDGFSGVLGEDDHGMHHHDHILNSDQWRALGFDHTLSRSSPRGFFISFPISLLC